VTPIVAAIAATILAGARVFALVAVGKLVLRSVRPEYLAVPLAILVAGGILGASYSLLSLIGALPIAYLFDAGLSIAGILRRRRATAQGLRQLWAPFGAALRRSRVARLLTIAVTLVYWLNAATPPRDTDSLRYHLAHMAQIAREGVWHPLAIVHYAFPFGWQTTYLPFVRLGLPEVAQLVNAGLWLLGVAAIATWRSRTRALAPAELLMIGALALHPAIATTVTTASVDAYSLFVALAVILLLVSTSLGDGVEARALGFAAWIGAQSRYQALAIGIATTAVVVAASVGALVQKQEVAAFRTLANFLRGAVLAAALAAPFYVVNYTAFANPAWPLGPLRSPAATPADAVASHFVSTWSGHFTFPYLADAVGRLVIDLLSFPLPLLALLAIVVGLLGHARAGRAAALWGGAFLVAWAIAQPLLYPRFALYLVPMTLVIALPLVSRAEEGGGWRRPALRAAGSLGIVVFGGYALLYTAIPAQYLATSDATSFHEFTWYHPVYEWANEETNADARMLVVVGSAESYYLNRYHRRADPATSAIVDWRRVRDGADLRAIMERAGFDFLIYEERDWSRDPGGMEMTRAVADALARGSLREERRFRLPFTRSRFRRERAAEERNVIVLRRL
jgi:hypothetical protein